MDLIIFYHELPCLVCSIPKHYIVIIDGDLNAQKGKDERQILLTQLVKQK